jgi:hypothetical protein
MEANIGIYDCSICTESKVNETRSWEQYRLHQEKFRNIKSSIKRESQRPKLMDVRNRDTLNNSLDISNSVFKSTHEEKSWIDKIKRIFRV